MVFANRSQSNRATVVYKIGGSLFDLPDLASRLRGVLSQRTGTRPLLIAGGGRAADVVREWDRQHGLGDERAHWLALESLRLNESLLRLLVSESQLVGSRHEADEAIAAAQVPILCAHDFLRAEEDSADTDLPHNWSVTSDSIAAWIALRWPADELILLKSAPLPAKQLHEGSVGSDAVDSYFETLAPRIPKIGWVNLRAPDPEREAWKPQAPRISGRSTTQ